MTDNSVVLFAYMQIGVEMFNKIVVPVLLLYIAITLNKIYKKM